MWRVLICLLRILRIFYNFETNLIIYLLLVVVLYKSMHYACTICNIPINFLPCDNNNI